MRIIEQALDGLPEGPWIADDRKVVLPPRDELSHLDGGADPPLQAGHRGLPRAAGRGLLPGRVARAASSAASSSPTAPSKPARVHFRDPSFVNLQSLRDMCVGGYIADLIQNLAMLDPILGGIDR